MIIDVDIKMIHEIDYGLCYECGDPASYLIVLVDSRDGDTYKLCYCCILSDVGGGDTDIADILKAYDYKEDK